MMKHSDAKKDKPLMEKVAKKAVKKHEVAMHAKGGKTNANMGKYGRNMAKVINQRSSSRSR